MTVEQINQNQTKEFLAHARGELEAFHISEEIRERARLAGSAVIGPAYFNTLFSDDPKLTPEARLASAFTGCVALERPELAQETFCLMVRMSGGYTQTLETTLVNSLGAAKRDERKFQHEGYVKRVQRLRNASKELLTRERVMPSVGVTAVEHTAVAEYAA